MRIQIVDNNAYDLLPLLLEWEADTKDNNFAIEITSERCVEDLHRLATSPDADLVILYDGNVPVGFIGLLYFTNPLGSEKFANEHYFYVTPSKRGLASVRLIKTAKLLAKEKGCSRLLMNASNLASDLHDNVCKLYERLGMQKFETSYISEV